MNAEIERRLEAAGVRVLPLEWQMVSNSEHWSSGDIYSVVQENRCQWEADEHKGHWFSFPYATPDAAKAAAEAHHRAAVLAQLGVVE